MPTTPTTKRSPCLNKEVANLGIAELDGPAAHASTLKHQLEDISWILGNMVLFWLHLSIDKYLRLEQMHAKTQKQ